jgi:hypothetical protein
MPPCRLITQRSQVQILPPLREKVQRPCPWEWDRASGAARGPLRTDLRTGSSRRRSLSRSPRGLIGGGARDAGDRRTCPNQRSRWPWHSVAERLRRDAGQRGPPLGTWMPCRPAWTSTILGGSGHRARQGSAPRRRRGRWSRAPVADSGRRELSEIASSGGPHAFRGTHP